MHWKPYSVGIMGKTPGEEKQANIELKTIDGSVKAHKVVLAEASPFFKALFSSNFKERTENVIDLSASFSSASSLLDVINFIYKEEIELTEDNIETCLCASCFFLLSNLTKKCVTFLFQNLRPSNCLQFWNLAFSFDLHILVKACQKMATDNFETYLADDNKLLDVAPETLIAYLKGGITKYCTTDKVKSFINNYLSNNIVSDSHLYELSEFSYLANFDSDLLESSNLEDILVWPKTRSEAYYIYHLKTNQWYKTPDNCLPGNMKYVKVGVGEEFDQILMTSGENIHLANMRDPVGTVKELPDPKLHLTKVISEIGSQTQNEDLNQIKYFLIGGDIYSIGSIMNENMEYEYFVISKLAHNHWKYIDCYRTTGFVSMDKVSVSSSENHAFIMIDKGKKIRVLRLNPEEEKIEMFQLVNLKPAIKQGNICFSESYVYLMLDDLLIKSEGTSSPWKMVEECLPMTSFHIKSGSTDPTMYAVCGDNDLLRYSMTDKELIPLKSVPAEVCEQTINDIDLDSLCVEKVPPDFIQMLIPLQ